MSADLAQMADRYRACLPPGRLGEMRIDALDRTGIPVVAADWDGPGQPPFSSFGYGRTGQQATLGALGELAESVLLTAELWAAEPIESSATDLRDRYGPGHVADPVSLVLPAGSRHHPDQQLWWLPTTRFRTGERVWVPSEFVACRGADLPRPCPADGWLIPPVTNGLGAGDTVARALSHALLEVVQRDGNTVSLRALEQGTIVDCSTGADGVDPGPQLSAVLSNLEAVSLAPQVRLAATEFAVVVHVTARDTDADAPPLAVTGCGEGAHPDREVAIVKAALEYAASRVRKVFSHGDLAAVADLDPDYLARELARPLPEQEQRSLREMTAWAGMSAPELTGLLEPVVLAERRRVPLADLPTVAAGSTDCPEALLSLMLDRLSGFDVLVYQVTGTAADGRTVQVVKALVSGLEVETLSYRRIGERVVRRLLDRGSPLVGIGPARGSRLPVRLTTAATERIGGPAWLDAEAVDARVGNLYPLYREPTRHAVPRLAAARQPGH